MIENKKPILPKVIDSLLLLNNENVLDINVGRE